MNETQISEPTLRVALEAVRLVYKFNIAYLQKIGKELDYINAIEELSKVLVFNPSGLTDDNRDDCANIT